MLNNLPKFKVSVRCYTFNQALYITDAMNGFTIQKTAFPFVCFIVDDASNDGEQTVIKHYLNKFFDSSVLEEETDDYQLTISRHKTNANCYFAVFYLKYNHYSIRKDKYSYLAPWRDIADYEAICEGDDYWINSDKLQLQSSFLDDNPNCGMVYSDLIFLFQKTGQFKNDDSFLYNGIDELIINNRIGTLTVMVRLDLYRKYIDEIQPAYRGWLMGDYPVWLWFEINSKIHYMPEIKNIYRVREESASHSKDARKKMLFINSVRDISLFFWKKYNLPPKLKAKIEDKHHRSLATLYAKHNCKKEILKNLLLIKHKTIKESITIIATLLGLYP